MIEPLTIMLREIPHEDQRYETCGDWRAQSNGIWQITASNMGKWQYAFLVLLHELVEMGLCTQHGVKEQDVTDFDVAFEACRAEDNTDEPGDDPRAPYRAEHQFATVIERMVCNEMGIDWKEYESAVLSLEQTHGKHERLTVRRPRT